MSMTAKDAFYFPHDSNARNDEKIIALRMKHGWEGYGLYWAIIEKLRDETHYNLGRDYDVLAYDLRTGSALLKSIIEDFGLFVFTEDSERFYSASLLKRMEAKDKKSRRLSEAGKAGNAKRWGRDPIAMQSLKEKEEEKKEEYKKTSPDGDRETSSEVPPPPFASVERIDHQKIAGMFNALCVSYPKVKKVTDERKTQIRCRVNDMKKHFKGDNYLEILEELFVKLENTPFCKGENRNGWKASFDWLFKNGKNWVKLYEGVYDEKREQAKKRTIIDA